MFWYLLRQPSIDEGEVRVFIPDYLNVATLK